MTAFLILAYCILCVASFAMVRPARPEPGPGFFLAHRYLAARLGWKLWPLGVPAALVILGLDWLALTFALDFVARFDLPPTVPTSAAKKGTSP